MNFTITRDITNETFSTEIKFSSYGGSDITSTDEQALLVDFPQYLDYNAITFSDKFKVAAGNVISDTSGLAISITPLSKRVIIDSTLDLTFSYNVNQILASEVDGTNLITKENSCEAKILLFEEKIKAQITTLINSAKAKRDNFLNPTIQNITI